MGLGRSYSWEFSVLLIRPREAAILVGVKVYASSLPSSKPGVGILRGVLSSYQPVFQSNTTGLFTYR